MDPPAWIHLHGWTWIACTATILESEEVHKARKCDHQSKLEAFRKADHSRKALQLQQQIAKEKAALRTAIDRFLIEFSKPTMATSFNHLLQLISRLHTLVDAPECYDELATSSHTNAVCRDLIERERRLNYEYLCERFSTQKNFNT